MKLDLETLKHVKFIFGLHSDNSTRTHGYRSLCDIIDKIEAETPKSYTEEEVAELLKIQRENCYVAVLKKASEDVAMVAIHAPEPSDRKLKKSK